MEDIKQVKLNIWGIRGGFRSFCHSEDLLVEEPEIMNTWKDIRDFVYVSDLNVRFYALEFTPKYKVFTLYRPVNDTSRTGAYVATTLYVPHAVKFKHILDLLKQISDAYYKDHYDAFGNPNTNPDYAQIYLEIVKGYSYDLIREDIIRPWGASAQDNIPCVLPFSGIEVVERFFDTPYRVEFLNHQEVMFWDVVYFSEQSSGVKFQKPETFNMAFQTDGAGVSEQFKGGCIRGEVPNGVQIVSFKRNGVDVTCNWRSCNYLENTEIEIEMTKPHHEPFKYSGAISGWDSPFVKQGVDFGFKSTIGFTPRTYQVSIITPEVAQSSFELLMDKQSVLIKNGKGVFSFNASQINQICRVRLKNGDYVKEITSIPFSKLFTSDNQTPVSSYTIEGLKLFKFHFDNECKGRIHVDSFKSSINFVTGLHNDFPIVLPKDTSIDKVIVEGYNATMEGMDPIVVRLRKAASVQAPSNNYHSNRTNQYHVSGNSASRNQKDDESWFHVHKKTLLFGLAAVVLLSAGLLVWLCFGREGGSRPVYTISIRTTNNTEISDITIVTQEPAGSAMYKHDTENRIELYKGWQRVSFVIQTKDEGDCGPVLVEYDENGPYISFGKKTNWCSVTSGNKQKTITITSPDRIKLEELNKTEKTGTNKAKVIESLAVLAEQSHSETIRKECVETADSLVANSNDDKVNCLSAFLEGFAHVSEAAERISQFTAEKVSIEQEEAKLNNQQVLLDDFRSKLDKVYSTECTKKAISDAIAAYENVKDMDERFGIIKEITGITVTLPIWFNEYFIPKQKEFFEIFEKKYSNALSKLESYLSDSNKDYFSKSQRQQMEKLKTQKTFQTLKEDRPNNQRPPKDNWKIYQYIKDNTK